METKWMLFGIVIFTIVLMNYRREGFIDGPSSIDIFMNSPAIFKLAIVVLIILVIVLAVYSSGSTNAFLLAGLFA